MSAWEGSSQQQSWQAEDQARRERLRRLRAENPSLSWADIKTLEEREYQASRPPASCCPCTTGKAEFIRQGANIVRCDCHCHASTESPPRRFPVAPLTRRAPAKEGG